MEVQHLLYSKLKNSTYCNKNDSKAFLTQKNTQLLHHIRCAILSLQTLQLRRLVSDLTCFHSIRLNKMYISESNRPRPVTNCRTRGNKIRYRHHHARLNLRLNSFFIRVPNKIYNNLPEPITLSPDTKIFKHLLLKHFSKYPPFEH
jgi:hypothetical protein